jgi:hypothetical protein
MKVMLVSCSFYTGFHTIIGYDKNIAWSSLFDLKELKVTNQQNWEDSYGCLICN